MNYIEEHGKKVAAVLCVASCFPVVAAVYAMETEPGWHGDRYINTDATVATGWQEIEGKSYYFDETGSVDQKTTQKATVATVSSTVAEEVQTNVSQTTKEVVQEEVKAVEEQKAQEAVAETEVVEEVVEETAPQEPVQVVEETTEAVSQPTYTEEVVDTTVQTPVTETQPVEEQAPVTDTTTPAPETTPDNTVTETPAAPQAPVQDSNAGVVNGDLNNRIASSAQQLVGVTDGLWCTQVVQQALSMAGVSDAMQLWPDEYVYYGYYTDSPQAGNLVYYDNGGRGVDHIAIYIGDGLAVHGNYYTDGGSKTVIASVYDGGGGSPQFIQVVR